MNNVGDQLNKVINNLSDKLGVAANKLYPILIKQAYIDGTKALVWIIISIIAIIFSIIVLRKLFKNNTDDDGDCYIDDFDAFKLAVSIIILIIALIIFALNVDIAINGLLNPNWYAIKNILNQINN